MYAIKYLSKFPRNTTDRKNNKFTYSTDHDKEIKSNFWGYTKSFLEKKMIKKTTFTKQTGTNFFKYVFNSTSPLFKFVIQSLCYSIMVYKV